MRNRSKLTLRGPSGTKNWLWLVFNIVGAVVGLCLSGLYLIYETPFGKVTPSSISLSFVVVTIFAAFFLLQDIGSFVKQRGQSLTPLGRTFIWCGVLAIQVWDITAFRGHHLLMAWGAFLVAVGCIVNLVALLLTRREVTE